MRAHPAAVWTRATLTFVASLCAALAVAGSAYGQTGTESEVEMAPAPHGTAQAPPQAATPDNYTDDPGNYIEEYRDAYPDRYAPYTRRYGRQRYPHRAPIEDAYLRGLRDGYAAGREDARDEARAQKLYRTRDEAMRAGLQAFHQGRYDEAADLFLLATELDHGDAASRLHAAQALFALQQYEDAVPLIRRALELQPKLLYMHFDVRRDYGDTDEFAAQLEHLQQYTAENPKSADAHLLLGYQLLFSDQRPAAHEVFRKVVALQPDDKLAASLVKRSVPLPPTRKAKPTLQPTARKTKA